MDYWTIYLKKPLGIEIGNESGTNVISSVDSEGGVVHWNTNSRNKDHQVRVGDRIISLFDEGDSINLENKTSEEIWTILTDNAKKGVSLELGRTIPTKKVEPEIKVDTTSHESHDENIYIAFVKKPLGLTIDATTGEVLVLEVDEEGNATKWNNTIEAKAWNGRRQIQENDQIIAIFNEGQRIDVTGLKFAEVGAHVKKHSGPVMKMELRHQHSDIGGIPKAYADVDNVITKTITAKSKTINQTFQVELKKPFGFTIGLVANRVIITEVQEEGSAAEWNEKISKTNEGKDMDMLNQMRLGDQIIGIWEHGLLLDMEVNYHTVLEYLNNHDSENSIRLELCHLPPGLLLRRTNKMHGEECGLRSITWCYFLGIVAYEAGIDDFARIVKENRNQYNQLKETYPIFIDGGDAKQMKGDAEGNPLATTSQLERKVHTEDQDLLKSLRIDIERTFAEMEYFTKEDTRKMLERILYIWAKEQGEMSSYKQGMHEILAVIVMNYMRDIEKAKEMKESENKLKWKRKKSKSPTWKDMIDLAYLEHDVYWIFYFVMLSLIPYYSAAALVPGKTDSTQPFLYNKIHEIHFVLLRAIDPKLWAHLEQANVYPQVFLMRWLRLLFSREFAMDQVFIIWDALLKSKGLEMMDYLCIAMLCFIRETLLSMNTSHCLAKVIHYPTLENSQIKALLKLAEAIQNGGNYGYNDPKRQVQLKAGKKISSLPRVKKPSFSGFTKNRSTSTTITMSESTSPTITNINGGTSETTITTTTTTTTKKSINS